METASRYPWGKGSVTWNRDATANDSDKSFTVPTGKKILLRMIYAEITATATVGNRVMRVTISNGTDLIYRCPPLASLAASQVGTVKWAVWATAQGTTTSNGIALDGTTPNVCIYGPIPEMILPAGYVIRVYDGSAVDAAADDMTVILHYIEYDA